MAAFIFNPAHFDAAGGGTDALLMETGSPNYVLLETGDKLLLE